MRRLLLPLLGLLCLAGCPKPGPAPRTRLPPVDPSVSNLVTAAGDRATLVLLVRPRLWPSARDTLKTLVRPFPLPPGSIEKIFGAPDLWTAFTRSLEAAEGRNLFVTSSLPGLDPDRPVVAALFEPQTSDATLAARALIPKPLEKKVPGVRHRILVPSTDPPLTAEALTTLLLAFGRRPKPITLGSGILYPFPQEDGFIAFIPEDRRVRIEILTGEIYNWETEVIDDWKAMAQKPPDAARLPMTPALHALLCGDDLVAAYVRPWQLRDLAGQIGSQKIVAALAYADPAQRAMLLAAGLAEVAVGTLLMSPLGAEVDDVTVGLEAGGALRLKYTQSLTGLGRKVYSAGLKDAGRPFTLKKEQFLARATLPVNIGGLLGRAEILEALGRAKDAYEMSRAFHECGWACYYHAFLRTPMGLLKTLRKFAQFEMVQHLPKSMEFVLVDVDPQNPDEPFKAVLAARMPKGYDTGWLRDALAALEKPAHTGSKIATHLEMRAQTDHDAILLGINMNPLEVLHIGTRPAEEGLLAGFELDTGRLVNAFSKLNPRVAAIFDRYTGMRGRTILSGQALFSELVVGLAGRPQPPWTRPREYTGLSWPSPGLEKAQSKGGRCLAAATRNMIEAFKALSCADPAYRTEIMAKAMDLTAREHLQCAMQFEDTREEAGRIRELMVLYIDEQLKNEFKHEQRIAHLKQACADGVEAACRREKEAGQEYAVELVSLEIPCGSRTPGGVDILTIPPSGPAEAAKSCAIAPDRKAGFEQVAKVLAKLDPQDCRQLDFVLMDEGGAVWSIPAKLEGPEEADFPVALKLSGAALQIVGPGGTIDIPEKYGRLDRGEINRTLVQIRATFPDATWYFLASAETSWEDAAVVLVAAACAKGGPHPVVFGQPPPLKAKPKTPRIKPGPVKMTSPMNPGIIKRVVRENYAQFKYCYEKQLVKNPEVEGKVVLKFLIGADGKVQKAEVTETTIESADMEQCMLRAAKRMQFPEPMGGGVVDVVYPFVFKASK